MNAMINFENMFSYSPMAYEMVAHVLTLGYAVMAAALFYFVLTMRSVAPKYRISSVLSVVVMVDRRTDAADPDFVRRRTGPPAAQCDAFLVLALRLTDDSDRLHRPVL